jgi:type IV pilus assembly protein PilV
MNTFSNRSARRGVRGVTLIEVLVALVIVAVGLLGLAGMQVRGLSIQKDAHGRAIATQLALDLADRMRSNRDPATRVPPAGYAFAGAYPTGTVTLPTAPANCAAGTCTLVEQAQFDVATWVARVRESLPGGWAEVQPIDATNQVWNVRLMWVETGFRARAAAQAAQGNTAMLNSLGASDCPGGVPAQVECQTIRVRP